MKLAKQLITALQEESPGNDLFSHGIAKLKGATLDDLKKHYPWVLAAKISNAEIEINGKFAGLTWLKGGWHSGTWEDGRWMKGDWFDGTWKNGSFRGGIWHKGEWKGGVWADGKWKSGTINGKSSKTHP